MAPEPPTQLPSQPPATRGSRGGQGRAFLGLALLGWGLSIVLEVTPHEDPWVGAGLGLFGLALLATSTGLPEFPRLPAAAVAALGFVIVGIIAAHEAARGVAFDLRSLAFLALGVGLAASAPLLGRRVRIGLHGRTAAVSSLVVAAATVLGVPLATWALQAGAKGLLDPTPAELFVQVGLLAPLRLLLQALGFHPTVSGQTLTYLTPSGPLTVEVGAACSGIQAMALFMGVLAVHLWIMKPSAARLALWSAIGIGGVYVVNLLRLAVLTLVGYQWGPAALVKAHAEAGWIFFVAWAIVFARLASRQRWPV